MVFAQRIYNDSEWLSKTKQRISLCLCAFVVKKVFALVCPKYKNWETCILFLHFYIFYIFYETAIDNKRGNGYNIYNVTYATFQQWWFMVTLKEIANSAGVSLSTVSAVLNNKKYCYTSSEKRKRILEVAENLGYLPNINSRALRGMPTNTIGIISSPFNIPIHSECIYHITSLLNSRGYHVFFGDSQKCTPQKEDNMIKEFLSRGVDGLIINSERTTDTIRSMIPACKIPMVNIANHSVPTGDKWSVSIDRGSGLYSATEHMIKCHGKKKIAFHARSIDANMHKLNGYRDALEKNGVQFTPDLCIEIDAIPNRFKIMKDFIVKHNPDAFVTTNDELAFEIIRFCYEMNIRAPDDIAVIGFDGLSFGSMFIPSLSTVRQPVELLAEKAVEILIRNILEKIEPETPTLIKPELVLRESCGCKKARSETRF